MDISVDEGRADSPYDVMSFDEADGVSQNLWHLSPRMQMIARYAIPLIVVLLGIYVATAHYRPLVFDASLFNRADSAYADVGQLLDAESIAAENAAEAGGEEIDFSSTVIETPAGGYMDGVWRGVGYGYKSYITVDVTIENGKIVNIVIVSHDEDSEWFEQAKAVIDRVIGAQSTAVDTVSGATYSSKGILEAIANALKQAAVSDSVAASIIIGTSGDTSAASAAAVAFSGADELPAVGNDTVLADGSYIGYARCTEDDEFDYYVAVCITVSGGRVVSIDAVYGSATGNEGDEDLGIYDTINDPYLSWAASGRTLGQTSYTGVVSQILADAASGNVTSSIDVVSGATYSCRSILLAYYDALQKAADAAGSSIAVPEEVLEDDTSLNDVDADNPGSETHAGSGDGSDTDNEESDIPDESFDSSVEFIDGIYTSYALCGYSGLGWNPYYIGVRILVEGGLVASLTDVWGDEDYVASSDYCYDPLENYYYLNRAINGYGLRTKGVVIQINNALSEGSVSTSDIDTVSGATYSSKAIIEAFISAVGLARSVDDAENDDSVQEDSDAGLGASDDGESDADGEVDPADAVSAGSSAGKTG